MRTTSMIPVLATCTMLVACGDTGTNATGASAEDTTTLSTTAAETTTTSSADASEGTTGPSTMTTAGDTTTTTTTPGNDDGPPPVKLDTLGVPDAPGAGPCGGKGKGGNDEPDFSYIWVANSTEGTVSKINTVTLVEEGRYRTRADANGSPSRTSVSLNGDVAVANRNGGVVKIAAQLEQCPDPDNTSSGAGDVLPFPDGCVVWFTPFNYTSQRPVAWAPGEFSSLTCRWENEMLWTSGAQGESIEVLLLNGEDGAVEELIPVPGVSAGYYGIYGAASDADGNFWGTQLGGGQLVNVSRDDFELRTWQASQAGGYGMTVDTEGRPWTCASGVGRFDPETETWATNLNVGGGGGCMVDANGHLWVGGYSGGGALISVDIETLQVDQTIQIPNYVHGVSIDFYGYVWGVTLQQPFAYRVDPSDGTFETFMGLTGPYTYSDMTGWALSNVVGGTPSG
jgi:hypothetical protein